MDALALLIMFAAVIAVFTKQYVGAALAAVVALLLWRFNHNRRREMRRARRALERSKRASNTFRPTTTAFPDDSRAWSADSGFGRDK